MTRIPRKDPSAHLGFDFQTNEMHLAINPKEWVIAHRELDGEPSGTKLRHYEYDTSAQNYWEIPNPDNPSDLVKIPQEHAYIQLGEGSIFREVSKGTITPCDSSELYDNTEYQYAVNFFRLARSKDDCETKKRPRFEKIYRGFLDPNNASQQIHLKHSFIKIGQTIYAMAGTGFSSNGNYGKVKMLVDETGNLFALKLPYSYRHLPDNQENNIARTTGLLIEEIRKQYKGRPAQGDQKAGFLMRGYQSDCFNYLIKLQKFMADLGNVMAHNPSNLDNYTAFNRCRSSLIDLMIAVTNELTALHEKKILHRDLKLENILVNFNPTTLEVTDVSLTDFGFSVQLAPDQDTFVLEGSLFIGNSFSVPDQITLAIQNGENKRISGCNRQQYRQRINEYEAAIITRTIYSDTTDIRALEAVLSHILEIFFRKKTPDNMKTVTKQMRDANNLAIVDDGQYVVCLGRPFSLRRKLTTELEAFKNNREAWEAKPRREEPRPHTLFVSPSPNPPDPPDMKPLPPATLGF